MKTIVLALIAALSVMLSTAPAFAEEPKDTYTRLPLPSPKWVLFVHWPKTGDITELQLFSNGHACVDQLWNVHTIYDGKGTLACALKWEKTK